MDPAAIVTGVVATLMATIIIPGIVLTAPRWFPVRPDLAAEPERMRRRVRIAAGAGWLFVVAYIWVWATLFSK